MFFVCILHVLNLFVSCVRLPPLFPNLGQAEVVAGKPRPSTGEPLLGRKSRKRAGYRGGSIPCGVSRAEYPARSIPCACQIEGRMGKNNTILKFGMWPGKRSEARDSEALCGIVTQIKSWSLDQGHSCRFRWKTTSAGTGLSDQAETRANILVTQPSKQTQTLPMLQPLCVVIGPSTQAVHAALPMLFRKNRSRQEQRSMARFQTSARDCIFQTSFVLHGRAYRDTQNWHQTRNCFYFAKTKWVSVWICFWSRLGWGRSCENKSILFVQFCK